MSPILFDISPLQSWVEQGYVLLTPNQRLARRIRREWDILQAGKGRKVWESLAVYPLAAWLQDQCDDAVRSGRLAPRLVLSKEQELLLWQQLISAQDDAADGGGLIHPAAAAEQARQARDLLKRWCIDLDSPGVRQRFQSESDCDTFAAWLEAFDEQLERSAWVTPADRLAVVAASAPASSLRRVALVDCDELAPLEQRCLDTLCESVQVVPAPEREGRALAHPFPEQRQELAAIAAWAARMYWQHPDSTIGIVLSDTGQQRVALDYLLRREFDCLGDDYYSLPVNFSVGIGLSRAPIVRDALAVLATLLDSVSVAEVVQLLHSRFLQLPDAGTAIANRFIKNLYERGSERIGTAALRNLANSTRYQECEGLALGEHLLAVSGMRELRRKALPSQWADHFSAVLDVWGWPGDSSLDSLEYQQIGLWYQTLETFRALDAVCGTIDCAEALRLLRSSCDSQVSHPQTGDSRLQVLGPLEAVGLAFDHLWVCGVQGGSWPSPPRPNPFIPLSIQSRENMPHSTPEREWQFSETLLSQYRKACGVLHASYSRQVNGTPELPSGLIADFVEEDPGQGELLSPQWSMMRGRSRVESLSEQTAPAPGEDELASMRGGSALIEHQSQCPFRAFAEHRLAAQALPDFVLGLSAAERGKIVHEALQLLWTEIDSHGALLSLDAVARDRLLQRASEAGIASVLSHRRLALGQACLELEQQRLLHLLAQWLDVEAQRGEFVVTAREQKVELALGRLDIRLRVDRMDTLADGGTVIIDYKTGKASAGDWLGARPKKPQLLLYGLAVETLPAALSFAQLRPDECAYVGIGATADIPGVKHDMAKLPKGASDFDSWEALNVHWHGTLQSLAQQFLAGDARVDPLPGSCEWCGLQGICRINDHTSGPEGISEEVAGFD